MRAGLKLAVVLGAAGVLATLTALHTPGLNGPWYWKWPWIRLDGARLFPAMLAAAGPFLLAQWTYARDERRAPLAVTLLMLSTLGLELTAAGLHRRPFALSSVAQAVGDPIATSYYSDARDLVRQGVSVHELLRTHAQRMPRYRVHTRFKPPGLLLYHTAFIRALGAGPAAALAAGLCLALLATTSVAATYLLILRMTGERPAAFAGASFLSLCPSLVLFLPEFDQVYPAVACALLLLWAATLARDRAILAVSFGVVLGAACFLSQMFLVLGIFLAGFSLLHAAKAGLAGLTRQAFVAVLAFVAFYSALWLVSGYDPVATYQMASRLLAHYAVKFTRPYPIHVVFDLLDFALGSGWISVVLVTFFLLDRARVPPQTRHLALLATAQILVTAVLGIVPGETARTWTLMLPLLMVPLGLELATWSPRPRLAVYGALWLLMVVLAQNMQFVIPARL